MAAEYLFNQPWQSPMQFDIEAIKLWLADNHPDSHFLQLGCKKGYTPLTAVAGTNTDNAFQVAELLISHGANVNHEGENGKMTPFSNLMQTMMYMGNKIKIAELLLKNGADPNYGASNHINYLCWAAQSNNHSLMMLLLKFGADPKRPFDKGLPLDKYFEGDGQQKNPKFMNGDAKYKHGIRNATRQKTIYILKFGLNYPEFEQKFVAEYQKIKEQKRIAIQDALFKLENQ